MGSNGVGAWNMRGLAGNQPGIRPCSFGGFGFGLGGEEVDGLLEAVGGVWDEEAL